MVLTAAVLLCGSYWLPHLGGSRADVPHAVVALTRVLQVAGAGRLILAALGCLDRPLRRPAVQWLGTRSFSLYLVHEPVVVAVGYLTGWTSPAVLLLTVPVSLGLAEVVFRIVERPAHRLARRAGSMVERRDRVAVGGTDPHPPRRRVRQYVVEFGTSRCRTRLPAAELGGAEPDGPPVAVHPGRDHDGRVLRRRVTTRTSDGTTATAPHAITSTDHPVDSPARVQTTPMPKKPSAAAITATSSWRAADGDAGLSFTRASTPSSPAHPGRPTRRQPT